MKALGEFLLGIVLAVIGAFIFLSNVTVHGFYHGFYRFGDGMFHTGTSTLAILVLLMCILFFVMLVKPNALTKGLMFLSFMLFIVGIILSLDFGFKSMSAFTLFVILAIFIAGLALIFKSIIGLEKAEKDSGSY